MRVTFEARDTDLLATTTDGRSVEVNPIGTSERPAVRVTVYEADRIVLTESVRFGLEVLTPASVLTRPVRRGGMVDPQDVRTQLVWTDPGDPAVDPAASIGQRLRRDMAAGLVLRSSDLEPALVIRRGEEVSVRTVRGSVVVTSRARARQDAALGQMVELEPKDRSGAGGARFFARAAGERRAVMIEDDGGERPGESR